MTSATLWMLRTAAESTRNMLRHAIFQDDLDEDARKVLEGLEQKQKVIHEQLSMMWSSAHAKEHVEVGR